jgi:hypothetical protein
VEGRRHDGVRVKDKVRGRFGGTRPIRTSEISGTTSYETVCDGMWIDFECCTEGKGGNFLHERVEREQPGRSE